VSRKKSIRQKVRRETDELFTLPTVLVAGPGPWTPKSNFEMVWEGKLHRFETSLAASNFARERGHRIRLVIKGSADDHVVYLMRGLPSCGKSHTAKYLTRNSGVICETDAYFLTEVGDDPTCYNYDASLLQTARDWSYQTFKSAVRQNRSPIVVDRGNGLHSETRRYVRRALRHNYRVQLVEPSSRWWPKIRHSLERKQTSLYPWWARFLARKSRLTHRVSARKILQRMKRWNPDLTIDDILERI
jgi:hypothetical protein